MILYKAGLIDLMTNQNNFCQLIKSVVAMVNLPIVTIILIYLKHNRFLYRETVPILDHNSKLMHKIKKRHFDNNIHVRNFTRCSRLIF